jgi:hypothetical protein
MSTAAVILLIIGGIIALVIIMAFILGKDMNIEHSIIIKKPKQIVFDYIKFVKNHDNFSVWNQMDPDMKRDYRGTDGQVGFVFLWESLKEKNVGKGEQEITNIKEGESIEFEIRFIKPWENKARSKMTVENAGNDTKITWGFYSQMAYPMNVMKGMFAKMLGKDLSKGLENLKNVLEKN